MLKQLDPRFRRGLLVLYIVRVLVGIAGIVLILILAFQQPDAAEPELPESVAVEIASAEDPQSDSGVNASESDDTADASSDAEAEEVDLGSGDVLAEAITLPQKDSATASSQLTKADLFGARTLGEALDRIPGLDTRQQGGSGQPVTAQIRGSRGQQVLVLVDGQPLSPAETADLSLVPLSLVESVNIIRGPQANRFGAGAVAGVIDIRLLTEKPAVRVSENHEPEPICENFSHLLAEECNPQTSNHSGSFQASLGGHDLRKLSLSSMDSDWFFAYDHGSAQNDFRFRRAAGDWATRLNNDAQTDSIWVGGSGETNWRAGYIRQRRGVPGSSEFPSLEARYNTDTGLLSARGESDSANWMFDLLLRQADFSDPKPYLSGPPINSSDTRLRVGFRYDQTSTQQGGWILHPRFDSIDSSGYGRQQRSGLDASYRWLSESPKRSGRLDAGFVASSDAGFDPVLNGGLSWALEPNVSAYASAGYSVRHPDFDELYLTEQGSLSGNPDLEPERLFALETGFSCSTGRSRIEAAAFYNQYEDGIIFAPVSAYQVKAINTGAARVAGLELLLDYNLASDTWWRTAYTWLPLAELDSGTPLTGRSSQHLNSRLDYADLDAAGQRRWGFAVELDCSGSIPADLLGSLRIAPRAIGNAELSFQAGSGTAMLSVSNILDRQARDSWNYPLPGREFTVSWRIEL